jgi:magnesium transporter
MRSLHEFGTTRWIDVIDPTTDELDELAAEFGLGYRTFDETHRRAARPMMRHYPDHVYIVAFSGSFAEIDMYLGPSWFITVRRHGPADGEWDAQPVLDRAERMRPDSVTSGLLLTMLLEELVDGYFDSADRLEDELEAIEETIFDESALSERGVQQELFVVRRQLIQLRRAVVPLREVLSTVLRGEVAMIHDEALVVAHDAFDKLLRAVDLVDEHRELVGNAVDAHLAVMSNQMNLVMKKLTAWGSIVFGATLIAGIYGMNFRHMPELDWKLGYPLALGMMAVMSVVLYRVFKTRDWL